MRTGCIKRAHKLRGARNVSGLDSTPTRLLLSTTPLLAHSPAQPALPLSPVDRFAVLSPDPLNPLAQSPARPFDTTPACPCRARPPHIDRVSRIPTRHTHTPYSTHWPFAWLPGRPARLSIPHPPSSTQVHAPAFVCDSYPPTLVSSIPLMPACSSSQSPRPSCPRIPNC